MQNIQLPNGLQESLVGNWFSGCRIPVVRTLRVRVDWVQFPASRLSESITGFAYILFLRFRRIGHSTGAVVWYTSSYEIKE